MNKASESEEMTCSTKYIFLDVVQFTHQRNVEAQSDIVRALNNIVLESVEKNSIDKETLIYIPTGDGICIALKNTEGRYPFDIHMLLALDILSSLDTYNSKQPDEMRKFQIRIGLNANEDNLVTDINGKENLAGAGISLASRIMDKASGSQLLVGESVFDRLQQRQKYMGKFKLFSTVDKHGKPFSVYQFIEQNHSGLNTDIPQAFRQHEIIKPTLDIRIACYFAHLIKNRELLIRNYEKSDITKVILFWFRAGDSSGKLNRIGYDKPMYGTPEEMEASFTQEFDRYWELPDYIQFTLTEMIRFKYLLTYDEYFEDQGVLFINEEGKEKLKREWPDVWTKFNLDDPI